jgi:hypothetical protein
MGPIFFSVILNLFHDPYGTTNIQFFLSPPVPALASGQLLPPKAG